VSRTTSGRWRSLPSYRSGIQRPNRSRSQHETHQLGVAYEKCGLGFRPRARVAYLSDRRCGVEQRFDAPSGVGVHSTLHPVGRLLRGC
jgi:hypothetical protein